jgi:hypothetical protein
MGPMTITAIAITHAVGPNNLGDILRRCRWGIVLNRTMALLDIPGASPLFDTTLHLGHPIRLESTDVLGFTLSSGTRRVWPNRRGGITVHLRELAEANPEGK